MARPHIKFPYCRWCLKTRDDPDKWSTKTISGKERKKPACGECGHALSWRIRKTQHKIKRTSVPNNVEQNLMTKSDIQNNIDIWKKYTDKKEKV